MLKNGEDCVGREVIKSILELFTSSLQYRDKTRLEYALWVGSRVLDNYDLYCDGKLEESVLFSLDKLIIETTKGDTAFYFSDALVFRKASAQLAFKVFCFYEKNKTEVPDVILRW